MKKTTLSLFVLAGIFLFSSAKSHADLIWRFTDDGNGNIRETISGTLDLSNGRDIGISRAVEQFNLTRNEHQDLVQVQRISTDSTGRSWYEVFDGHATNPSDTPMINMTAEVFSHWQNTDFLLFQVFNDTNRFVAGDFAGNFASGPTAMNEDVVHNVSISAINEGVWRFGNLDDNVEGNGVLFIVGNPSSVPEPSSALMFASALGFVFLRGKKRTLAV